MRGSSSTTRILDITGANYTSFASDFQVGHPNLGTENADSLFGEDTAYKKQDDRSRLFPEGAELFPGKG